MLAFDRKTHILQILQEESSVSVALLSSRLSVSEVTVRKMLNSLARQGLLRRTRGGAVNIAVASRENDLHTKAKTNTRQKKDIARKAYEFIADNETVYIDAGTTTLELVRLLRGGNKRNVSVVTNALNIAVELIDVRDLEVILTGGKLRHGVVSCVGPLATASVASLVFDKAFIGANHISLEHGPTTPDLNEAEIKRSAAASSIASYLLCDSSKFGGVSMAKIVPLESFTAIITDDGLSPNLRTAFSEANINLILAESRRAKADSQ